MGQTSREAEKMPKALRKFGTACGKRVGPSEMSEQSPVPPCPSIVIMASQLPLDFSHPAVREYVNLIRLQVLTPLSTLVSVAAVLATEFIVHPSLSEIVKIWPTSISPRTSLVAFYLLALFGVQVRTFLYDDHYQAYLTFQLLDRLLLINGSSLVSIDAPWCLYFV